MLRTARTLLSLYSSYGLLVLANALFTTLTSLRADIEGFAVQTIGLIMAGYFLGMFLGARYTSKLIQRGGHIRAFAAFASFMSLSPLMHVLFIDPWVWAVLRLVDGFCLAGLFIITESWLNARADNKTRGSILAIYMVVNYLASGLGQLFLLFASPDTFEAFAVASICFSLSLMPLMMTRTEAPVPQAVKGFSVKPLLKVAPAGFFGAVCAGSVGAAFFAMAPIYVQNLNYSVQQISLFMMAGVFSGLVLQVPLGKLSDRIERRKVLAGVCFGALVFSCMMILHSVFTLPFYMLLINVFCYGSLAFVIYPLSVAHVNDWSDPNQLMQTSSGMIIGYGGGAIFGPMLSSSLMSAFGPAALFGYIAINLAVMMYAIYQSKVAGLQREKMEFVVQPAVQFPTEELYAAAQDDLTPVPEDLYISEEKDVSQVEQDGSSALVPDIVHESALDETGLPVSENTDVVGALNKSDDSISEEDLDQLADDLNALADEQPVTTESLIEAWEQEQLADADSVVDKK
ncbi:MFS transporter [Nitrincola schmidtii]|uniref:MFS transporter n=1 Tax=Nitrincola schmidtii TaxID=1730894 RepID=UPI00124CE642|nr:MFS transporter [Nitrincola schmidtii]